MGQVRIVVTGMGWVTPLGHTIDSVWQRLVRGESGVDLISRFDASTFPTTFAAQVRDYDFTQYVKDPAIHRHARLNSQYALGAATQAWKQSGLDRAPSLDLDRVQLGVYESTTP